MTATLILSKLLGRSEKEVKEMLLRKRSIFVGARAYLTIALLLFGNIFFAKAQLNPPMGSNPWKYVNPTPFGFVLQDMSFIDNNNGLAVGANGSIAKTTDGGFNWQYIFYKYVNPANQVGLAASLNDVQYVTPTIAYAVGSLGVMIKSTDGGINWTPVTTPLTALNKNINGLHFLNKDTGYIGGQAIKTTNTTDINDAPKIYVTKNGGATWDSLVTPFVPQQANTSLNWNNQKEIWRIQFVNDSVGYACGSAGSGLSPLLWKIEKGVIKDYSPHRTKFGMTTGSITPLSQRYLGLMPVNDSLVIMGGTNAVAMRVRTGKNDSTVNAVPVIYGAYTPGVYEIIVWLQTTPTIPTNLSNFAGTINHFRKTPDGKILMQVGKGIVQTADNGTTWTIPSQPVVENSWWNLTSLDVTPNARIVVGGTGGVILDSLPGSAWRTPRKNSRPLKISMNGAPFDFTSIDFADCNNGVAVGTYGTIVKTSDGGKTWIDNSSSVFEVSGISISNVVYPNLNNMFFTTATGVWRSADQGTTNVNIFTEPNTATQGFNTNYFTMVGQDRAFVAAFRGSPNVQRSVIFRTLNASAATPVWDTVKTFPNSTFAPSFRNIKFANTDTGYVTANRGKVYRTVDGGNTWTDVSPDTTAPGNSTATYTALSVINGKTLYVGGSSKKLFKSTDAGATWTDLTLALTTPSTISNFSSISAIAMNDVNNGYLTAGAFLLKTTDGWATWTYDIAPLSPVTLFLYPKIQGPIANKKLLITVSQAGFFDLSTNNATILEYGNAAAYTMSTTETATNSSCTNPTAGTITVNASGGILPYSYSIDGGAPQASNVFTGLTQGAKTITIRDAGCQVITKSVTVPFTDNLVLAANNDTTICAGAPVQLLATGNAATFSWTTTTGLSNPNISNPIATVIGNTTYTVTASLNGCVKTKPVAISIKPNPLISAGPDKTIGEGDKARLDGDAINNRVVSIAWTPSSSLDNPTILTPTAKPQATTTYTLTIRNTDNCTSTDAVTVNVVPYCVSIMNAFTPNGDGTNDRWMVTKGNTCTTRIKAVVFNRYGQEVYNDENYQNNWDGTYKGKPVADGTYYYAITYYLIGGRVVTLKGDVTILR